MAQLGITVLGPFGATLDGQPITEFGSNKVRALLAYLAVETGRPQSRETLAALLWPDWPQPSAMGSLRYVLSDLRKNIGDRKSPVPFLLIEHNSIQLNPGSDCQVDIREFEKTVLPQLQVHDLHPQTIDALKSAVDLYKAPFLDGFSLPDSAPFEEWLTLTRDRLNREMMDALEHLVYAYQQRQAFTEALSFAYRQVELEPWREEAHQQIMRLLAYSGQRSAALAQFETCRQALKTGLDIEPGEDTLKLYAAIRSETLEFTSPDEKSLDLPPTPGRTPFMGLHYFDEFNAGLFFGREALTARLMAYIIGMAASPVDQANPELGHVLAVVGASGSGKSSLVRAGLAPALRRELHLASDRRSSKSTSPEIHIITPTAHPLESLAMALPGTVETLPTGQKDILIIDQFEELFTLCHNETERVTFLDHLLVDWTGRLLVILVLRADFYAHCALYPRLRQALASHQVYIGPMSNDELRRAIEEPARQSGWDLEPGLVELILRDVGDEPGGLPLLEHALLETWQRRSGKTLTVRGYTASGGVHGAIAHTAENVFHGLTQQQQGLTRRIFVRLTELGEGTQDTRRRAALTELVPDGEDFQGVENLLKELADARLITLAEGTAEVAHEALIREWPALRSWLSEDRDGLRLQRHLTETALEWLELGKDSAELYRGARLAQALEWAARPEHAIELNALETEFLNASQAREASEAKEREAMHRRELAAAQRLAETEQKRAAEQASAARRLRRRAIFLAGAACLAFLLAVAAGLSAITSNNNARLASAHQLASAAETSLQVDSGQSIALALQSLQFQPAVDAYSLLHRALFSSHLRASLLAYPGIADAVYLAVSPAGDRLATSGGNPGEVRVWRVNGAMIDPTPLLALKDLVWTGGCKELTSTLLAFSKDGSRLAVGECDPYIVLVDAHTGALIRKITPDWGQAIGVGFSPDGRWLAGFSAGGQITLWDAANAQAVLTFQAHDPGADGTGGMTCFDFSPDGKILATGGNNGEVKFWSLENGTGGMRATLIAQVVQRNEDYVQDVRFSPDGHKLADATLGALYILDLTPLDSGLPPAELVKTPLNQNKVRLNSIYFTPAGDHLVTTELGTTVNSNGDTRLLENEIHIWDTATGVLLHSIAPEQELQAGIFSPDGQTYYSVHIGGVMNAWDISNLGSPEGMATAAGGNGGVITLSPDGKQLLEMTKVDIQRGVYQFTWQQIVGSRLAPIHQFTINLGVHQRRVLVNKKLSRILVIDLNNFCRVYDASNGVILNSYQLGPAGPVGSTHAINADASQLLVVTLLSDSDTVLEVWDILTGKRLNQFHIADSGFFSAFSPDEKEIVTYGANKAGNLIDWRDPATGQIIKEMDPKNFGLAGVIFTPDQKYLLSWSEYQTLNINEVASGKLVRTLSLPVQINSVTVSPDGKTIAVSLANFQTTLYSFADGHELVTLPGSAVVFLPDQPAVMNTNPDDAAVYAFSYNNNDVVRLACDRLKTITLPTGAAPTQLKLCQNQGP